MRLTLMWLVALAQSGCAFTPSKDLDATLNAYTGRPVSDVFAKLGPPDSQGTISGRTFYLYTRTAPVSAAGQAPVTATCTLRFIVNGPGTILRWTREGNPDACEPYGRRLG